MDPKLKTALAVVIGIVIGATLIGGAVALPAAFHAVAFRAASSGEVYGPGMMGARPGIPGEQGMMDPRGQAPQWGTDGARPGGAQGQGGMRGRGPVGPQDGNGLCPNGTDAGTCPGCTEAPATES